MASHPACVTHTGPSLGVTSSLAKGPSGGDLGSDLFLGNDLGRDLLPWEGPASLGVTSGVTSSLGMTLGGTCFPGGDLVECDPSTRHAEDTDTYYVSRSVSPRHAA